LIDFKNHPSTLELGKISGVVGLKGGLKFIAFNPGSDLFSKIKTLMLDHRERGAVCFPIVRVEKRKNFAALFLKGIETIDAAEKWMGARVTATFLDLRAAGVIQPEEFFFDEVIGFEVWIEGHPQPLGKISGFFPVHADPDAPMVCVVKADGDSSREILLPCHSDLMLGCDRDQKRLVFAALAMDTEVS